MKTFDANDCYIEQRCSNEEIGTSWEPRWGVSDLRSGACKPGMVGTPKPVQMDADVLTDDELKHIPQEFVYEYELADYHRDRMAYRSKGGNVLALLRIGEERKALRAAHDATLASLTATKLKAMASTERMLKIIQPVLAESDDVRERLFTAWGATPEYIAEMLAEAHEDIEGQN